MDAESKAQRKASDYWRNATNTFVAAADYYERVDVCIANDILPLLGTPDRVLDIAAGNGRYTIPVAPRAQSVVATDISQALLQELIEAASGANVSNITTKTMDAINDEWPAGEFDLVMCMGLTSILVERDTFLSVLENLARHVTREGFLLMRDTLTTGPRNEIEIERKRPSVYRARRKYLNRFLKLGFAPVITIILKENEKRMRQNCMFLFKRTEAAADVDPDQVFAGALRRVS